ncbi:hypothetical protein ACO03_04550 [Pantoea ananatis]|nr:hypothetical protein ACO03_04550 [Pantoea ananatis]
MASQWNKGDTVRLKSGGPVMTVVDFSNFQNGYVCEWFEKDRLQRKVFSAEALTRSSPRKN